MITLVIIHAALLSLSVLATTGSAITAAAGFNVAKSFIWLNVAVTTVGVLCGVALLFMTSLDAKCAVLFAYVVLFGLAHAYVARRNQLLATSFGL